MKTFTLTITPDHIARGIRRNACECAAALALREMLPGATVRVYSGYYRVNGRPYLSPAGLVKFVRAFDTNVFGTLMLIPGVLGPCVLSETLEVEDSVQVVEMAVAA